MAQTYYVQENNTPISELVAQGLADGDTIQLQGKNLVIDIITCGSADPDFTDEVDIGVTIKNDGGGECNLEFKDLTGIRLNATLPGTVHPWVDPDNPLPARLKDGDPRIIHDDPYCTKLTANARVEIQLAGNFSLGGVLHCRRKQEKEIGLHIQNQKYLILK